MYSDVNVELKDTELEGERKDDEEMTHASHIDDEHENVNQEIVGDQVKDVARVTVTAAPATQKTEVPLQSSCISSDYATKFLNFDNIPSADTEIISIMEIQVQHENQSCQTSLLLTVPVPVIPKSSTTLATTIPLPIPPFIPFPQQSTPITTPTTTEATISTTSAPDSTTLTVIHQRLSDFENEVKTLKNVDHSLAIRAAIKSEVLTVVKEYIGTSLDDTLHKKRTLFETMTKTKSFNKNTKHKALYHALMKSILEDEDTMDKGIVDKSKKRKPDDAGRDEVPPAGSNQGLKRKKISKDDEPSTKAKSTKTSKGTTKSQPKSTSKSAQVEETVFEAGDAGISDLTQDILALQPQRRGHCPPGHIIMKKIGCNLDKNDLAKKRSRIMVKDIDRSLLERRLMRSLEKFVGGREYREDLRLLQRTI
ncbi:hypothetical protein Tco_1263565 [Tanacetum coccineum]